MGSRSIRSLRPSREVISGMIEPTTYAEWSDCVDIFETGEQDDAVVLAMSSGTLNWNSGVATLFSERISGAFNIRLQRCADRMERDFKTGGDETTVVRALLDTRRTLTLLHRVATIPSFPDMLREHLTGEIRRYAERAQQSLEDSAKHDRSGRLASLMRNNSLLRYEPTPEPSTSDATLAPEVPEAVVVPATEAPLSNEPATLNLGALPRSIPTGKTPLIVAAVVAAICVVAGGAWFSMHGKNSKSSQTATLVTPAPTAQTPAQTVPATPTRVVIPSIAPEPSPTPTKIASPVESVPSAASETVRPVLAATAPQKQPVESTQPTHAPPKRVNVQPQDDSSKTSALAAIVTEGEGCFNKKKFDCAISAAGSALRLDPSYGRAVDLKRRAEAEQKRALDSISIN